MVTALALGVVLVLSLGNLPKLQAKSWGLKLAVSTESERASREAMAQLTSGGNAVDAAVTAALIGGITNNSSSGIGGGAFIHYFDQKSGKSYIIDAREVAPLGIQALDFEKRPFEPEQRGKYVGVPGEVAGLYELHRRFGKLEWKQVVQPAVDLAEKGFLVGTHLARSFGWQPDAIARDPGLKELWLSGSGLPRRGARVQLPKLAQTLARIAAEGPKAFYEGPIAADIVNSARAYGSSMTLQELAAYRPQERTPLSVKWGDYQVHTMPPPSAGGLMLVQALKLYTPEEIQKLGYNTPAFQHALAESFRASIADRMRYVGDPAFEKFDLGALLADERMKKRRASIAMNRTHALPRFGLEEHGTHHLNTADAEGNVVALTTTINRSFGAKIRAPKSGVVLNDELDDFTSLDQIEKFGMQRSPNRPRPGARPVSSMTPTIVLKDGKAVLAAGGSGGMTIATNTSQIVISRLAFGIEPFRLLKKLRFQIPTDGQSHISLSKKAKQTDIVDLERRGEIVSPIRWDFSAVQLIAIDEQGRKDPASDPRKHGFAIVR